MMRYQEAVGEIVMRFRDWKRANLVQSPNQKISPYAVITKRFFAPTSLKGTSHL